MFSIQKPYPWVYHHSFPMRVVVDPRILRRRSVSVRLYCLEVGPNAPYLCMTATENVAAGSSPVRRILVTAVRNIRCAAVLRAVCHTAEEWELHSCNNGTD
jgi:hypothetical protein